MTQSENMTCVKHNLYACTTVQNKFSDATIMIMIIIIIIMVESENIFRANIFRVCVCLHSFDLSFGEKAHNRKEMPLREPQFRRDIFHRL